MGGGWMRAVGRGSGSVWGEWEHPCFLSKSKERIQDSSQEGSFFNQLFFVFRTKVEMTQWGRKMSTACPGHTIKTYMLAKGTSLPHPSLQRQKGPFWPGGLLKHSTGEFSDPSEGTLWELCSLGCSHTKGFVQIPSHYSINAKKH